MKRKLLSRLLIFMAFVPLFGGCELDGCMVCQLNTYESGLLIIEGAEAEYCGPELALIRSTPAEVDGAYTYRWDCR